MKARLRREPLRVTLVLQNMGAGGAERVMANLANHLDPIRFEVDLVLLADRVPSFGAIENPYVRVISWDSPRALCSLPRILRYLSVRRPDVVLSTLAHINILMAMIRPMFPSTRFLGREANIPSMEMARQRHPRLMEILFRRFYPKLDGVVCQSEDMRYDLTSHFGMSPEKLSLIHNPVDFERIGRLAGSANDPFPPGRRNILYVGRLEDQKRPSHLIRLAEEFGQGEGIHLHIVGGGSLSAALQGAAAVSPARDRITFWGLQENPFPFMKHADALVLTSSHEGFPNVVLEANACGLPVVAYRAPGVSEEIIRDGFNGWLVGGGDIKGMAEKVRLALAQRPEPQSIREHTRHNYDIGVVIAQYERILEGP